MSQSKNRGPLLFLGAEGTLYVLFLALDLFRDGAGSVPVKYASIVLCALTAVYSARRGGDRLTAAALACTLGADTFLLLLDRWYLLGVLLFFGVQVCYALRLAREGAGLALTARGLLWASLTAAVWLAGLLTPLTAAAALYLSSFLVNLALSHTRPGRPGRLMTWGLALYLCCDVWVGIYNYPQLFPPPLTAAAYVCMWLFYLPGQVLLVLSGLPLHGS